MRQFVQLWVCRYLSTGSCLSLAISPVGYTSTFSPPQTCVFFVPPPHSRPSPLPLCDSLNSGEKVWFGGFRIKCAICFKKNSNKKKGIRVIAPFIFCEEDGRVQKDHPAWLKFPKSPTVRYCCTPGNRLALGQLKIMSKLNGASTVQVRGCVEVWAPRLFVSNRKEKKKKDRTRLHEAKWQHQYMWQSIVMTWANLQKARVIRGHLSEDRQLRHGSGVHWEHRGGCVQREGRGRGGEREREREEEEEEEVQILRGDLEQEPRGADYTWGLSCQRESSRLDPFIAWSGLRGCISQCFRRSR